MFVYNKDHPFSPNFKFQIPIKFNGQFYYHITDLIEQDVSYDVLYHATLFKFFGNVNLIRLFAPLSHVLLVPNEQVHPNEQEIINRVKHYFVHMESEKINAKEKEFHHLLGDYNVVLTPHLTWKRTLVNPVDLYRHQTYSVQSDVDYFVAHLRNDALVLVSKNGNMLHYCNCSLSEIDSFIVLR